MSGQLQKVVHPATTLGVSQIKNLHNCKTSSIEVLRKGYVLLEKDTNLNYKSRALSHIDIGPGGKGVGHDEFIGDSMQIYNLTLMFIATNDKRYAVKAISIQDEWNTKCVSFKGSNAPLECAWGSACMVRAIELLKYSLQDWRKTHFDYEKRFIKFLNTVITPNLRDRYNEIRKWNNNWILSIQEALLQIYLFSDDIHSSTIIIEDFKKSIKNCVPLACGMCTETKRDLIHTQFQIGSMVQIAEICWHQGIDIYSINNNAILHCMEYHASILNGNVPKDMTAIELNNLKDKWFMACVWDIGYNHFINRGKVSLNMMVQTDNLLKTKSNRPEKLTFNWGPGWIHFLSY
jgi:hypothetical protein